MKKLVWPFFLLLGATSPALAAFQPEFETPPPILLEEIQAAFPEGQVASPRLLDYQVDPNLRLFHEASIQVTFWGEGAALQNSFGYFLYRDLDGDGAILESEIMQREILWENASEVGSGGSLRRGDSLRLGSFPAGTQLGFFLVADGYRRPGETYYSIDAWNPDGQRHLAMLATTDRERIILGIEDLPWASSDRDYNDILFTVSADPKSALREAIDAGHIPVQDSVPAPPQESQADPIPAVPGPQIAQSEAPPAFLEGSGLGCQLGEAETASAKGYRWGWHWLGAAILFSKSRFAKRRPSVRPSLGSAAAGRPGEEIAQSRAEIAASRQGA